MVQFFLRRFRLLSPGLKIRNLLGSVGVLLGLSACNFDKLPDFNNVYFPDYEGNIALMIVNDTVKFRDFLEDAITDTTRYSIDNDQRILFSYLVEQDFGDTDDFVEISDFTRTERIASPINTPVIIPEDTVLEIADTVTFNFPVGTDERIDSIFYQSGIFTLEIRSDFPSAIAYDFITNSFLRRSDASAIIVSDSIVRPDVPPGVQSTPISLNGYKTILDPESNEFHVILQANVYLEQGMTLTGNEEIQLIVGVNDADFEAVFGYLGQDSFEVSEERLDFDFFDDLGGEGIEFRSPSINFTASNSFGIPITLDFSQVYAEYGDGSTMNMTGEMLKNINPPALEDYGATEISYFSIDETNSNLRAILAGSPTGFVMPLTGYTNYEAAGNNFILRDSEIDIEAKVSIPLNINLEGFEYSETVDFSGLTEIENSESLSILITTINEFPFTGYVDLYMLDESGSVLDSIVGHEIMSTPVVFNDQGRVIEPSENTTTIDLSVTQIQALAVSESINFTFRLDSYSDENTEFVEVFADYDLIVKIGVSGDVSIDLNGN